MAERRRGRRAAAPTTAREGQSGPQGTGGRSCSAPGHVHRHHGRRRPAPPRLRSRRQFRRRSARRLLHRVDVIIHQGWLRCPWRTTAAVFPSRCTTRGQDRARSRHDHAPRRRKVRPPEACYKGLGRSPFGVVCPVVNALSKRRCRRRCIATARYVIVQRLRARAHRPDRSRSSAEGEEDRQRKVTFLPDPEDLRDPGFHITTCCQRTAARATAFLNSGARITIARAEESTGKSQEFLYKGGLSEFVTYLNQKHELSLHKHPIHLRCGSGQCGRGSGASVLPTTYTETRLLLREQHQHRTRAARTSPASRPALTRIARTTTPRRRSLSKNGQGRSVLSGDDVREGLTAVLSVKPCPSRSSRARPRPSSATPR